MPNLGKTRLDRRRFLAGAGVAAAAAGIEARAQDARQLRMVTSWPKNFPGVGTSAERLAQRIGEASGGALTVKVYAAGELVGAFEAFDAVATGAADLYHAPDYYWHGKHAAFNFFTTVPFGLTADEFNAWIHFGGGQALWDELAAKFGIKPLLCGSTGTQMGGWFTREINTLDDLKGLKMRMAGIGGEVLRRLGVNIVTMPGGEIFTSLQNGTIDAAEWVGPWNDLAFGLHKVAKYYYGPGFHEPAAAVTLGVNTSVWTSLAAPEQAIVANCAAAETLMMLSDYVMASGPALAALAQEGVQVRRFPDDMLVKFGEISGQVLKEIAATDEISKRIYDSYMTARRSLTSWTATGEESFLAARRLPFPYE